MVDPRGETLLAHLDEEMVAHPFTRRLFDPVPGISSGELVFTRTRFDLGSISLYFVFPVAHERLPLKWAEQKADLAIIQCQLAFNQSLFTHFGPEDSLANFDGMRSFTALRFGNLSFIGDFDDRPIVGAPRPGRSEMLPSFPKWGF